MTYALDEDNLSALSSSMAWESAKLDSWVVLAVAGVAVDE